MEQTNEVAVQTKTAQMIKNLNKNDKIALLAEIIGFKTIPVDINTFISDDYYLGGVLDSGNGVYQIWKDALNEIYPDPINTKTFVCFNGAIRTGKSNTSKIMILYDIYKMCCLGENIWKFFELVPRPFFVGICHQSIAKAQDNINELWEWIWESPWFVEQINDENSLFNQFEIRPVKGPDSFIGRNMCLYWMTECNYFAADWGTEIVNSAISRIEGTFKPGFDIFIHVILDSSDTTNEAVVPVFLRSNAFGRDAIQYKYAIYDAKPHLYYQEPDTNNIDNNDTIFTSLGRQIPNPNKGKPRITFRVYKGDSELHPCIMPPYGEVDPNWLAKMDPDKYIDVPLELIGQARNNIELFLQEKCGQAIESTMQYFNPTYVVPRLTLPNLVHSRDTMDPQDIVYVDFFDPTDTFMVLFKEAVLALPKDRCIFGRIDLGIANDRAGFSIGYVENLGTKNVDGVLSYDPDIRVPISVGISRLPGQETSIEKLCDLIQWIHSVVPFYEFTTDTFQSYAIQQKCRSIGINARFLSVDRTKTAYQMAKNAFYNGKITVVENKVLKTELLNVYDVGNKIDHHNTKNEAGEIGSDSKDIADSLVGLIQSIYDSVNKDAQAVMEPPMVSDSQRKAYTKEVLDAWVEKEKYAQWAMHVSQMYGSPIDMSSMDFYNT